MSDYKRQYTDLDIDRNLAPIDLEFLGYLARQLRHAAERGESAVNIHLYRVPVPLASIHGTNPTDLDVVHTDKVDSDDQGEGPG